jgi:hypothetical protein
MWIVVTLFLYVIISAAIGLHVWNMEEARKLHFEVGKYFAVHRFGYTVQVERGLWSISSIGVWFRLLRYGVAVKCRCLHHIHTLCSFDWIGLALI